VFHLIAAAEDPDFLHPEPIAIDEFVTDTIQRWRPTAPRSWQLGWLEAATVLADLERLGMAVDAPEDRRSAARCSVRPNGC